MFKERSWPAWPVTCLIIWSVSLTITPQVAAAEASHFAPLSSAVPPLYGGKYLALLLEDMEKEQEHGQTADSSRREALSKQLQVLRRLITAVETREKPVGSDSQESTVCFDEEMDEAEVLLRLFREVDKDGDGHVSLDELLAAPQLRTSEVGLALRRAVGCSLAALEEVLQPLKDEDLSLHGSAAGGGIKAVFEAIGPSLGASTARQLNGEGEDDRIVTRKDLERFLGAERTHCSPDLASALKKLAATLRSDEQLDFLAFKVATAQVPRVAAQRLEWVRSMSLDEALARHLPPGTLDDG